jgi:hypothetical protein
MKKTIYNVAVLMESQEQCDRMKQLCIDNGLPYWDKGVGFRFDLEYENYFRIVFDEFYVTFSDLRKTLVTESEFIQLLKQEKA